MSLYKTKRLRLIFIVYWFLLVYIIAALVWWFIALNTQNHQMALYKISEINKDDVRYEGMVETIKETERRKTAQYIGEGSIFLLLIIAGAVFIFRAVRRQFKSNQQQHNFMMAITHELKTPIAVTKLNLETLQRRKLDESQQQRLIQNTIQEANRLNTLCNNMLLASQIEAGRHNTTKEEINLSEALHECVQDFKMRFPQRILQSNIVDDLFIIGDRLLLQMGINNLIDNAIKYSPKDSVVTIDLIQDQNRILLSVKDEGRGIEVQEKKKVFDKYYRIGNAATKAAKGTGLGLYLTKKIAQQHNANISMTDNTPSGCIFTINFKSAS
ncbi:sensor histidine kinase [Ferruginibacter sp. SUN002]|uniref:sensor histidine kinase n=1 Tax=Ferruginibacter sp. SUN002 TaxID=2937789 RepID=UPI003D3637C9